MLVVFGHTPWGIHVGLMLVNVASILMFYAIGRLLLISYFDLGAFEPGARAGLSFWRRYAQEGAAPWPRVAVQVARFLLQSLHFELCALRKNRPGLLPIWTRLMEEWLDSPGPSTLARLGGES
jgi:hypothetical protein